jgi:hypothetical protein
MFLLCFYWRVENVRREGLDFRILLLPVGAVITGRHVPGSNQSTEALKKLGATAIFLVSNKKWLPLDATATSFAIQISSTGGNGGPVTPPPPWVNSDGLLFERLYVRRETLPKAAFAVGYQTKPGMQFIQSDVNKNIF